MRIYEIPIAHRGLHNKEVPENSMQSFELAIEKGFNIETDVHLTKDGTVVCFHDFSLKRMLNGIKGGISSFTIDELRSDAKYQLPNGEFIPTLKELIDLVNGKVDILVELKSKSTFTYALERNTLELVKDLDWISVQSFNPISLIWFNKNYPATRKGQLDAGRVNFATKLLQKLGGAFSMFEKHNCNFLAYNINQISDPQVLANKELLNYKLLSWTVDTPEKMQKAKDHQVDNIIFEKINIDASTYKNLKPINK
ncbi:MAG: glycerophosphodiester phosphodiesterase family protein [Christensenellales bacterium]|jgi:glycerophosphoryl diester phosphodiesterase|nr:hypothetical protein [Clostridiales bacterium]